MVYGVVDEYNLTLPGNYLDLYFPASNKSIMLYVVNRHNPTYSLLNYGPLPTTTSSSFSKYPSGVGGSSGSGSANPAAAGQVPASSWIKGIQFNVPSTFFVQGTFPWGNNDIWYTQVPTTIFEVSQYVTPAWLRIGVDIPTGQVQQSLQEQVAGGVDQDFGWRRGNYYVAHIPNIHYGYGYGNDTNLPVYTRTIFRYAEDEVVLVTDPNIIFGLMANSIPSHRVIMPISESQSAISQSLVQTYGFDGVPVFSSQARAQAMPAIMAALAARKGA